MTPTANGHPPRTPRVAIVGAGMSGLCMAAKLRRAGIESFTLYERGRTVGGTWRDNTYPGLTCDIPSRYYSYTFAPNREWTHVYPPGAEIWDYLERVCDQLGVRERIRFDTAVEQAEWVDGRWRLRASDGSQEDYDFIVSAAGVLRDPNVPDIPGLDSFEGASFHSARWDHTVPLAGRRVAVIGTGSTGVQISRELAYVAGRFELYQRTPQWIFPLPNKRYSGPMRWLARHFPAVSRLGYRAWQAVFENTFGEAVVKPGWQRHLVGAGCRLNLRRVRDAHLRRRLTPRDEPMCKRLVMDTGFYPAMQQPGAVLVDQGIDHVEPGGIVTRDGRLHELDVIVLATGFQAHRFLRPVELVGPGGLRLSDVWGEREPRAYKTVALPGFPNFFMLMGPHSPFGNQSLFTIAETQADYLLKWIARWRAGDVAAVSPRQEPTDRFYEQMRQALPSTAWVTGCQSWYIGKDGLPFNFPWAPADHRALLAEIEPSEWEVQPGPAAVRGEPAATSA